jgi:mono/diheme cytochrome c family protein
MRVLPAALAMLALPALAAAQQTEHLGDPARGQGIAQKSCSGCHAVGREDTASRVGKATAFRTLAEQTDANNLELMAKLDDLELLDKPEGKHPPVQGVDRQQYRDIVAYIRSLIVPPDDAG